MNCVHHGVGVQGGERKGNAGAKPIDAVPKSKILGLPLEGPVPDGKTVWV